MGDKIVGGTGSQSSGTMSQHEINYTPSEWSKRFKGEELLTYFFQFCGKVTADVRKNIKCELNVPYGNTERSKYDVYGTDLAPDAPIFIFIHGGYWQEFSKEFAGFSVPAFVKRGVKVVNVGYDLCPNVRLGDIVAQIKVAIEQILKNAAGGGCKKVWIAGHSAGAHLAAGLLHDGSWMDRLKKQGHFDLIKGILLISGVYELEPILTTSFNGALQLTDKEVKAYSFTNVDSTNYKPIRGPKVIVVVGECDSPTFIDGSQKYAQKILTFVDDVEYILLRDNIDHFDIVEKLVQQDYLLTKLLLNDLTAKQ